MEITRYQKYNQEFFNIELCLSYEINDIVNDISGKSWIVKSYNSKENSIELVKYPLQEVNNDSFILNLNDKKMVSKIGKTFKGIRNLKDDKFEILSSVYFDKSKIYNYKKHDVIVDKSLKSWIVYEKEEFSNTLKLVKFPVFKY